MVLRDPCFTLSDGETVEDLEDVLRNVPKIGPISKFCSLLDDILPLNDYMVVSAKCAPDDCARQTLCHRNLHRFLVAFQASSNTETLDDNCMIDVALKIIKATQPASPVKPVVRWVKLVHVIAMLTAKQDNSKPAARGAPVRANEWQSGGKFFVQDWHPLTHPSLLCSFAGCCSGNRRSVRKPRSSTTISHPELLSILLRVET